MLRGAPVAHHAHPLAVLLVERFDHERPLGAVFATERGLGLINRAVPRPQDRLRVCGDSSALGLGLLDGPQGGQNVGELRPVVVPKHRPVGEPDDPRFVDDHRGNRYIPLGHQHPVVIGHLLDGGRSGENREGEAEGLTRQSGVLEIARAREGEDLSIQLPDLRQVGLQLAELLQAGGSAVVDIKDEDHALEAAVVTEAHDPPRLIRQVEVGRGIPGHNRCPLRPHRSQDDDHARQQGHYLSLRIHRSLLFGFLTTRGDIRPPRAVSLSPQLEAAEVSRRACIQ